MKTTSILESIRNKINKIEKNNNPADNSANLAEPHDDFEYIDDSSKHIVETKHNAGNYGAITSRKEPETAQATDEDFDFLSENNEEENAVQNNNVQPPKPTNNQVSPAVQDLPKTANDIALDKELGIDVDLEKDAKAPEMKIAPFNKIDDLDLENLEEETKQPETKQPEIKQPEIKQPEIKQPQIAPAMPAKLDDLDLDNIDLDLEEDKKVVATPQKIEDIDIDLEEELKEAKPATINAPQNNSNTNSMSNTAALEDINVDLETPVQETSIPNNYQQPMKDITQNKTSIISDDIAKRTASTIKEMISSVPKTQNHQVLSTSAPAFKSGETIEDMVSALLAPKLEQWIHENLPPMVEKIVKNEIKKLLPQDDH